MNTRKSGNWHPIICYALIGVLLGTGVDIVIAPTPAQAQSILDKLRQIVSPPTERGTAPGRSEGGAIRGNCTSNVDAAVEKDGVRNLVALIPRNNIGTTVEAYPTFWFYTPTFWFLSSESTSSVQPVQVKQGEFMLLDDRGQPILKRPIPLKLANQASFSRFTLPKDPAFWMTEKSLEVGKRYNWFFSIVCDASQPAKNPTIRGWVERIEQTAKLKQRLQQVAPSDRYQVYVEDGNWFESLTLLAENRQTQTDGWLELLKQLRLSKVANAPIATLEPTQSTAK